MLIPLLTPVSLTRPTPVLRELLKSGLGSLIPRGSDPQNESAAGSKGSVPGGVRGDATDLRTPDELRTLELLGEDFVTYDRDLSQPGFWAVATHRLGRKASQTTVAPLRVGLDVAYKVMFTSIDWVWGIHLPRTVELGRRVRLWHNGCMLLTAQSIGNDVHIRHDTTFGPLRGTKVGPQGLPIIEDRADIGSGACVLGGVRVGHDAVVGANSVVIKNVPPHATVLGVPARIVPT
jgi:serine O-acetyltransferase